MCAYTCLPIYPALNFLHYTCDSICNGMCIPFNVVEFPTSHRKQEDRLIPAVLVVVRRDCVLMRLLI